MSDRLDADTVLLHVVGGHPLPEEPPGLAAFAPPRRTARGREKDALFLCLGLRSRSTVAPERFAGLLALAAATFYGSPGSITSALRQALAAVNQDLLDHNLRESASGAPVQGGLICAALRGSDFYAVQCGPGLVLVAHGAAVERFPNLPSRPLGLSNALDAHYFHTTVREAEYFCLSRHAPTGWSEASLAGLGSLATLTNVLERLKDATADDLAALVGRFEPSGLAVSLPSAPLPVTSTPLRRSAAAPSLPVMAGLWARLGSLAGLLRPPRDAGQPRIFLRGSSGKMRGQRASTVETAALEPVAPPMETAPLADPQPETVEVGQPTEASADAETPTAGGAELAAATAPATDWSDLLRRAERLGEAEPLPSIPVIEDLPPAPAGDSRGNASGAGPAAPPGGLAQSLSAAGARVRRGFRSVGRALGVTLTETVRGLRLLLARMLPEGVLQKEGMFTVPTSVQIAIALVIPLIVVGVAAGVYVQRGRAEQFTDTLTQAQVEVTTARLLPDPLAARPHWEAALSWLAQAERLRPGDSRVAELRREAQAALDELDWITRLDYRPLVVGGLGREVEVKQVLLVGSEVYALDGGRNRVLHVVPTANNTGYAVDPEFVCAGGTIGQFTIGNLVDISLLPGPTAIGGEAIVALDSAGGLLYCAPGLQPLATYLPSPDMNWIRPTAFEVYADRLYVLDPGANEVWQFQSSGGAFNQPPTHYFTGVAYDLQDVIEFSIAGGDLFLLRRDGRVAHCSRPGTGAPATCVEAVPFSDSRLGRAAGDRLTDVTAPTRLVYSPPPEPSLYLLNTDTASLYQLSLRLVFVRQFRPRFPLPAPITSVVLDPAKQVYVGAGDNIYFAPRP